MNNGDPQHVRVLTVADLHQSRSLFPQLTAVVAEHRPDVVAFVGDMLDAFPDPKNRRLKPGDCARAIAGLPVEHLIFVRGNHEDHTWPEFVAAWPHDRRPLTALYGTSCTIRPLVIVGFPCLTGSENYWCAHLLNEGNVMEMAPAQCREELPVDLETWLPDLMRRTGPAGRTLWLLHESPVAFPLSMPRAANGLWWEAVVRFQPKLSISGHDHCSPIATGTWHARVGHTTCVNVGQAESELHYVIIDFEFANTNPSLPTSIHVRAFPWKTEIMIYPCTRSQN